MSTLRFLTPTSVYSVSTHPADTAKRERALTILAEADGALSVQVLQEFYVQATRAALSDRLLHADAVDLITGWTFRFPVQELTLTILNAALEITAAHRLSYWDSAIIAAAHALVARELYTEDMNDGQRIAGVLIVNPFR